VYFSKLSKIFENKQTGINFNNFNNFTSFNNNNFNFCTMDLPPPKERKTKGCIWELGFAIRQKDEGTGKNIAICKVKIDQANPDLVCNKKLSLPDGSTSTVRHHIKSKHPTQWIQLLNEEKSKTEVANAKQEEANQLLEQMEGDPDEIEEDLTQSQVT
jgi:hypothetical protein